MFREKSYDGLASGVDLGRLNDVGLERVVGSDGLQKGRRFPCSLSTRGRNPVRGKKLLAFSTSA
jgi:hypothetical protein